MKALQDLRLVAAVQLTHYSQRGRYAGVAELKHAAFLDPAWPRAAPGAYLVSCEVSSGPGGFACYADAVAPEGIHFRADATQVVRWHRNRRAGPSSPVFGVDGVKQ